MVQFSAEESTGAIQSIWESVFFDGGRWTADPLHQQHPGKACNVAASQCCCLHASGERFVRGLSTNPVR